VSTLFSTLTHSPRIELQRQEEYTGSTSKIHKFSKNPGGISTF